jgi:hypothetical protein
MSTGLIVHQPPLIKPDMQFSRGVKGVGIKLNILIGGMIREGMIRVRLENWLFCQSQKKT